MAGRNSSQTPVEPSERMGCSRPSHELKSPTTLTARAARRRPHREGSAGYRPVLSYVGAQPVVELLVAALADQVLVELADRRQERVGIVDRESAGVAVVDVEPVAQRQLGVIDDALEHAAGVDQPALDGIAA